MSQDWFAVDKAGLAKLLEKRGKAFALFELLQNAWDTGAKEVRVTLEKIPGKPWARLVVEDDDPNGFVDLAHAYTLFAESVKKDDPTKRGRFNLGEKLVLALCKEAKISSTTGTVVFLEDGSRKTGRHKTEKGSVFEATIRMTNEELDEVEDLVDTLILPEEVKTSFNGRELMSRKRLHSFRAPLPTMTADHEGNLVKRVRATDVHVYEPKAGEVAHLYEMGIPVVETGDKYHVDVQQKVPLNIDRDNVHPAYLRKLRVEVFNALHDRLTEDDSQESWVTDAMSHKDVTNEAVTSGLTKRFGEKRAIFDPNDKEANQTLTAKGYTVVSGRSLPKAVWSNVRRSGAMEPSGRIQPTPKAFQGGPDALLAEFLPREKWTEEMTYVAGLVGRLSPHLVGKEVYVAYCTNSPESWAAAYGDSTLTFSLQKLSRKWFDWDENAPAILKLVIHELAHDKVSSHLDYEFQSECCRIGAKLTDLALSKPTLF